MGVQWLQAASSRRPRPVKGIPDGTLLYDGVCVLCSSWIRFVAVRDRDALFRFVPVQSPWGIAVSAALGIDPADPDSNAVVLDGTAYYGIDAALAVLGQLPGWGWSRIGFGMPGIARNWIYDRIARNRYAVFGRDEACAIPPPWLRERVLEHPPSGYGEHTHG